MQDLSLVSDSLTYCRWVFPKAYSEYTFDHLGDVAIGSNLLFAVTGIVMTEVELIRSVGERGTNLERLIMIREGRRRKNDTYNNTVFKRTRKWFSKMDFTKTMDKYYLARGWDPESGIPSRKKLEQLELAVLADEMETRYGIMLPP